MASLANTLTPSPPTMTLQGELPEYPSPRMSVSGPWPGQVRGLRGPLKLVGAVAERNALRPRQTMCVPDLTRPRASPHLTETVLTFFTYISPAKPRRLLTFPPYLSFLPHLALFYQPLPYANSHRIYIDPLLPISTSPSLDLVHTPRYPCPPLPASSLNIVSTSIYSCPLLPTSV